MWTAIASRLFYLMAPAHPNLYIADRHCRRDNDADMARASIQSNPRVPDGYLYLARSYCERQQWDSAISILQQALAHVPSDNVYYPLIQSERQAMVRLQFKSSTEFSNGRIPYDIAMQIFQYLDLPDLFTSMTVCRQWCYNILDWPMLWDALAAEYPRAYIPRVHDPITGGCFRELRLDVSSTDACTSMRTWTNLLYYLKSPAIESLYLDFRDQSSLDADTQQEVFLSLASAIRCASPYLQRLTIYDAPASKGDLLTTLLESCAGLRHVSIQVNPAWRGSTTRRATPPSDTCDSSRHPLQLAAPFALTRLELSMDYPWSSKQDHHLLMDIIRRCPQLEYLALDADDHFNHGAIIRQAAVSCPRLKTCIVRHIDPRRDDVPKVSHHQQHRKANQESSNGLETLVVTGWHAQGNADDLYCILSKHHSSIKYLHLDCDTRLVDARLLARMGGLGFARLEELRLTTAAGGATEQPSIALKNGIETLLLSCPHLATLEVNGHFNESRPVDTHPLSKQKYPVLRHLILGTPLVQSFLLQSTCAPVRMPALERLELIGTAIADNVIAIVKNMVSLKHIQLVGCTLNAKTESNIEDILASRRNHHIKN